MPFSRASHKISITTNSEWIRKGTALQVACIHLHFSASEDGSISLLVSDSSSDITEVRKKCDEVSLSVSDDISTSIGIKSVLLSTTSVLSVLKLYDEIK